PPPANPAASARDSAAASPPASNLSANSPAQCIGPSPLPYPLAAQLRRRPAQHKHAPPDSRPRPPDTAPAPPLRCTTRNPPADTASLSVHPSPKMQSPNHPAPTNTPS